MRHVVRKLVVAAAFLAGLAPLPGAAQSTCRPEEATALRRAAPLEIEVAAGGRSICGLYGEGELRRVVVGPKLEAGAIDAGERERIEAYRGAVALYGADGAIVEIVGVDAGRTRDEVLRRVEAGEVAAAARLTRVGSWRGVRETGGCVEVRSELGAGEVYLWEGDAGRTLVRVVEGRGEDAPEVAGAWRRRHTQGVGRCPQHAVAYFVPAGERAEGGEAPWYRWRVIDEVSGAAVLERRDGPRPWVSTLDAGVEAGRDYVLEVRAVDHEGDRSGVVRVPFQIRREEMHSSVRAPTWWLPVGLALGGVTRPGSPVGFWLGAEASLVHLWLGRGLDFPWFGLVADVGWDAARGSVRAGASIELGFSLVGLEAGYVHELGRVGRGHGLRAGLVVSLGALVPYVRGVRYPAASETSFEVGVLLKFPFPLAEW